MQRIRRHRRAETLQAEMQRLTLLGSGPVGEDAQGAIKCPLPLDRRPRTDDRKSVHARPAPLSITAACASASEPDLGAPHTPRLPARLPVAAQSCLGFLARVSSAQVPACHLLLSPSLPQPNSARRRIFP